MPSDDQLAKRMLDLAARLAMRARGDVEPNPLVGAVVVRGGKILGVGHHRRFGGLHAEREALDDCRRRGHDPRGSTVYCTLEPCASRGKQPACTEALIDAGVARVVHARRDPHPLKGGGSEILLRAGIESIESDASPLATGLAAPFAKRVVAGLPWVVAKWAQTIDGRVATRTGESKWISGERARARVHRLRARVDAILTGLGTVVADDPMLNARGVGRVRRVARRVIVDADLETPLESQVVRTAREVPTIVACLRELVDSEFSRRKAEALREAGVELLGVPPSQGFPDRLDLHAVLRLLWERHQVSTVMVESGPGLLGGLFEAGLVDEAVVYLAPMLLGDEMARAVATGRVAESLTMAQRFTLWRVKHLGADVELTYRARPGF